MGIELPPELADVAAKTGVEWPEADEDGLRQQAGAWRQAAEDLGSLAGDADMTAGKAIATMSGPSGEAARQLWSGFVEPDSGTLTSAARGATEAADRLDHAAEQVGTAKVEMVRQLVDAAKNADAAHAAADSGHPVALAGLDTTLRGAATNLSAVSGGLVDAVGPAAGPPVEAVGEVVNPNPGAHTTDGQSGLLSAATGLPSIVVDSALPAVEGLPGELADSQDDGLADRLPGRDGPLPGHDRPDVRLPEAPSHPVADGPRVPAAVPSSDAGTGPIVIPDAPTPPRGSGYGGFVPQGDFGDAPTPPSGSAVAGHSAPTPPSGTHLAGLSGAPPAAGPPVAAPPPVVPPGQQFAAGGPYGGQFAPQPFGGQHYAPPAAPYGGPPAPGAAPGQQPAAPGAGGVAGVPHRAPVPGAPARWGPAAEPQQYAAQGRPPEPVRPQPAAAPVPLGSPRQERESIVALFVVHMFPIGHLPVATDRPARQLPVPAEEETAGPAWLRFPPHDHPDSGVIDPRQALAWLRNGWRQPAPPPSEVLPCPPAELTEGHDPLGDLHEREWERRYLVQEGERPEYAWPPGEQYPEGGCEEGEPVLLSEGTELDRFGTALGRVFAVDSTPFAQRSLPPGWLEAGYRRYRVLREVPMWQAISVGWFAQPGGGVRYRSVYSAAELVTLGYLADITFEERP